MTTLTHESLSRMIMLSVQFRDFGHYEMIDGKRCYVTTREQTDNLQSSCDRAAKVVLEHIEVAQAQTVTREQIARALLSSDPNCFSLHWPGDPARTWVGSNGNGTWPSGPPGEQTVARFLIQADAILSILGRASDQKEGA